LEVQARVVAFFEEVTKTSPAEKIVLVSHGGTIRWLMNKLFPPEIVAGYHFYNTSVTSLQCVANRWMLVKASDISHLDKSVIAPGKRY
jgi:broad specificity phosphatase PhoE